MSENKLIDPRRKFLASRCEEVDLKIPQFTYDINSIGDPPEKEVTFSNLNDNINKKNLEDMCTICGRVEEIEILYHPKTKRHMGLAKVVFRSSRSARMCVEKYNNISKMGNIMSVKIDIMAIKMYCYKDGDPPIPLDRHFECYRLFFDFHTLKRGKIRKELYNNIIYPPIVSQSELTPPSDYYPQDIQQSNFVISSDDVIRSSRSRTKSIEKSSSVTEEQPHNSSNAEVDNASEYSDDGHKYAHGNSVVSSSLDPSRMVASSLTTEPLEPLDIRIQKLLTGTSLCTDSKPKLPTDHNDISSSTEPFRYEEAISQQQTPNYNTGSTYHSYGKRSYEEKTTPDIGRQSSSEVDPHRSRHSSKSNTFYRYHRTKSPPKKLTDRDVENILAKLRKQFIEDLKETLHRDICKKMIETTAYGSFHNWWDFKENEHKSLVVEKIEPTEGVLTNSSIKSSTNLPDRSGEKSTAFKTQLSQFVCLPKIKRLARPPSPKQDRRYNRSPSTDRHHKHRSLSKDRYIKHRSPSFDRHQKHRDYYYKSHHSHHHRHSHHSRNHHERYDSQSSKTKHDHNDCFVSETDGSDLGVSVQSYDKSLKKESPKKEKGHMENERKNEKYDEPWTKLKPNRDVRKAVDKIWESSEGDTDKTETMAANVNQEKKVALPKVKFEKIEKSYERAEMRKETEKIENKIVSRKPKEVKKEALKEKVANQHEKKITPLKALNKYEVKKLKMSSSGSESDDEEDEEEEEEEMEESETADISQSSESAFTKVKKLPRSSVIANNKKPIKRSFDSDDDDLWECPMKRPHSAVPQVLSQTLNVQIDTLTYESEVYFHDLTYWEEISEQPFISLSYNLLTNQHKPVNNRFVPSMLPSRRKQSFVPCLKEPACSKMLIVDSRSRSISVDAADHTDNTADHTDSAPENEDDIMLENFIDGPYQWDEIIVHDHLYFRTPKIGTSITYMSKVTKSEYNSNRLGDNSSKNQKEESVIKYCPDVKPLSSEIQSPVDSTPKKIGEIFSFGIDAEDMFYFHEAYKRITNNEHNKNTINFDTEILTNRQSLIATVPWVDIPCTKLPPPSQLKYIVNQNFERIAITNRPLSRKRIVDTIIAETTHGSKRYKNKRRKTNHMSIIDDDDPTDVVTIHSKGCSRTQGYYKLTIAEKKMSAHGTMVMSHNVNRVPLVPAPAARYLIDRLSESEMESKDNQKSQIREARNEQRRLQTEYHNLESTGELLKINHLGQSMITVQSQPTSSRRSRSESILEYNLSIQDY